MAIKTPNYTQFPNEILDFWMSKLSGAEFKTISVIARKTFGWGKKSDKISVNQIAELTGLSNRKVIDALRRLQFLKLIKIEGDERKIKSFEIIFDEESSLNSVKSGEESSPAKNQSGEESSPAGEESSPDSLQTGEESSHTKEISIKNTTTKEKETELFNAVNKIFFTVYEELNHQKPKFTKDDFAKMKVAVINAFKMSDNPEKYISEKLEALKKRCIADTNKKFWFFTPGKLIYGWNELVLEKRETVDMSFINNINFGDR